MAGCHSYRRSYILTTSGWHVCGTNMHGDLGLGHTQNHIATPVPLPGSEGVTRWDGLGENAQTFGFSDDGVLTCGWNYFARCGVETTDEKLLILTPVALPDDVKGRVDRVVMCRLSTFFFSGRRCFACGYNPQGQLGVRPGEIIVRTPIELPVPVDDIILHDRMTVIRSGDTLLACGDNDFRLISADDRPKVTTPTPLELPGPVTRLIATDKQLFVQTDGSWVGRGQYRADYFLPIDTKGDITQAFGHPTGWIPVTDEHAKKLNALKQGDCVLFFPEPITNKGDFVINLEHAPTPVAVEDPTVSPYFIAHPQRRPIF